MSFAAFKHLASEAFSGEPVAIEISRREQHWWLTATSFDGTLGLSVRATAETCPTPAAVRSFCLAVYKSLAEAHEERPAEDENLRASLALKSAKCAPKTTDFNIH